MSQRLGEGNSRGSDVSEVRRKKFKRIRCLRAYEKEIQEDQMSQSLWEGNSRGADVSKFMRRKFKRARRLRGYVLRIILFYILAWKMIQDVFMVTF